MKRACLSLVAIFLLASTCSADERRCYELHMFEWKPPLNSADESHLKLPRFFELTPTLVKVADGSNVYAIVPVRASTSSLPTMYWFQDPGRLLTLTWSDGASVLFMELVRVKAGFVGDVSLVKSSVLQPQKGSVFVVNTSCESTP